MGSKRSDRYSDPLTPVQKKELKHKEHRPDGEKKHLQIISYSPQKLIEMLCDQNSTVFEKSIAKEEILRRLVRNQKRTENYNKTKLKKKEKYKGFKKFKQKKQQKIPASPKTGLHIGQEYKEKLDSFLAENGDTNSCPFD
jgi:hypothetical protein